MLDTDDLLSLAHYVLTVSVCYLMKGVDSVCRRGGSEVDEVVASGSKWREGAGGLREACQARSGPLSDRSWPRRKQALELDG